MKVDLKLRNLSRTTGWRDFVRQELNELDLDTEIESAQVVLEQQTERAPACETSVVLVVPGPDIHASARDHTILAAWLKTRAELERQIRERKSRPITRLKSNMKSRATAARRA